MESFLSLEFDLHQKEKSEEALRKWRQAVGTLVKNRRRRFRYAADLQKRSEAKEQLKTLSEKIPITFLTLTAALRFLNGAHIEKPTTEPPEEDIEKDIQNGIQEEARLAGFKIHPDKLASLVASHDIKTLTDLKGSEGLADRLNVSLEKGVNSNDVPERQSVYGANRYTDDTAPGLHDADIGLAMGIAGTGTLTTDDTAPGLHEADIGLAMGIAGTGTLTTDNTAPALHEADIGLAMGIAETGTLTTDDTAPALHEADIALAMGIAGTEISPIRASTRPHLMKIKSKWQKGKLIGRGTFGSVYVALNIETGALCAIKEVEMLPDDSKSAECIRQLEQEIKVLSHLKHPNIVQYYGSEIVGDKFYIYLEYVHPGSINKFIHDHYGAITESVVRNFTRHILRGLAYLHSKKTIHRDIKGANLLVDAYGVVKLADFGVAKHLNGQTAFLSLKGSPYWMAPELLQSTMQTNASSDVALAVDTWSLGCTIIEMMDGKPPWSEYEGAAAMFKVLKETPPIPETMSAEGKDFLQRCFRRNPAERPTASELLDHPFVKTPSLKTPRGN